MKGFYDHVAYRQNCDDCGEMTMVAVVKRGRLPSVRICRRCFPQGNWRRSTWHDARFHRIRANRLSKQLGVALRERDHARDLAVALEQKATYHETVATSLGAAWNFQEAS